MIQPPNISAERLFRLLLRAPRASLPVSIPGAPPGAFRVVAVGPLDEAEVYDEAAGMPAELRGDHIGLGLASLALHDDGERVFRSGEELARLLPQDDADRLVSAVLSQLRVCSPSAKRIDYGEWLKVLMRGARKLPGLAIPLARCVDGDVVDGAPRPDRFFGVPMADLTDGQWLVYRATRRAFVGE